MLGKCFLWDSSCWSCFVWDSKVPESRARSRIFGWKVRNQSSSWTFKLVNVGLISSAHSMKKRLSCPESPKNKIINLMQLEFLSGRQNSQGDFAAFDSVNELFRKNSRAPQIDLYQPPLRGFWPFSSRYGHKRTWFIVISNRVSSTSPKNPPSILWLF